MSQDKNIVTNEKAGLVLVVDDDPSTRILLQNMLIRDYEVETAESGADALQILGELSPDLIIISLGTNEAIEYPYVDPRLTDQLDEFINQLKNQNPKAQFILTIPMDFYKKKTRRNPGVEVVRKKLIDYADSHDLAYWDLYTSGGGKHAADLWKKSSLLQSDGIHFTKAGYELQGSLLYEALIKGYNEYVLYRYP